MKPAPSPWPSASSAPTVTNFLDLAFSHRHKDIHMEEIPVSQDSPLADIMLKDSGHPSKIQPDHHCHKKL